MREHLGELIAIAVTVCHVLGFFNAVHAIMHVRSPQGVIAWVATLIIIPELAIPFYWVFGRYRFAGYVNARRSGDSEISHIAQDALARLAPYAGEPDTAREEIRRLNKRLVGIPCTRANHVELLVDGAVAFEAIFAAMDEAKSYVLVQFFIVHADRVGQAFRDRMVACARRGVRVHFLFDSLGSRKLPRAYVRDLRANGIEAHGFASSRGPRTRLQINFRNHRKAVIVDGRVAFIGGMNLGDEYLGRDSRFGPWRDTLVRLTGPAVQAIQLAYLEDWYWQARSAPELRWEPEPVMADNQLVSVIPSGPADELETCHLFFLRAINAARERLWITSPYFVPDHAIVTALQLAALRGVDVRIMLPEKADHLLVFLSSHSYLADMHKVGAKMYRYTPGFMHQKVTLIDRSAVVLGTANMDSRSFYLNFELTLLILDPDFAAATERMLERDFARCRQVTEDELARKPWWYRAAVRFARVASPLQ
jgi:cardiolipin synthase